MPRYPCSCSPRGRRYAIARVFRARAAHAANADLATIGRLVSNAIAAAWGNDEASPDSGFRPGELATRESDGLRVPAVALRHSYSVATYVNHATSRALDGKLLDGLTHRDARDNLSHMSPALAADGTPLYAPNGKPRVTSEPLGASFEVDGYAVTYRAGITWKFLLGFDPDGGMTMYHLRYVLPPSRAHPNGKDEQYLFRAYIPDFGTGARSLSIDNHARHVRYVCNGRRMRPLWILTWLPWRAQITRPTIWATQTRTSSTSITTAQAPDSRAGSTAPDRPSPSFARCAAPTSALPTTGRSPTRHTAGLTRSPTPRLPYLAKSPRCRHAPCHSFLER